MKVAIVHDSVGTGASADEVDTLIQAGAVATALNRLGHQTRTLELTLDLDRLRHQLLDLGIEQVFNLVESVEGQGRLIHLAPALFESMPIAFTGAGSQAMVQTTHKPLAKRLMVGAGLPTPSWIDRRGLHPADKFVAGRYIWKSAWEHASRGLDDSSVVEVGAEECLRPALERAESRLGGEAFGELFVDGREFNVALLAGGDQIDVLPPAEIVFDGYGSGKPRIVGYAAKWEESSFEYRNTRRTFEFTRADDRLVERLGAMALECWRVFDLAGYARVDFRVDGAGRPWILEVNANPCLSPDAGFAAALERAGIPYERAIERIVGLEGASLARRKGTSSGQCEGGPRPTVGALPSGLTFRSELGRDDPSRIREIVRSSGFFSEPEVAVAEELANERLARGEASGYHFVLAEAGGRVLGYTCYGPIACTQSSFDLYWIAIHDTDRAKGIGRELLRETERRIAALGGDRVYAETSSRDQYAPTRAYYLHSGFQEECRARDFYGTGDSKVVYCKVLTRDPGLQSTGSVAAAGQPA